jgi:tetratricopeptide (TPR) repeat protein
MDKAISLEPSVDSHLRRAGLLQATGQLDKAMADANAARELDPGSTEAITSAIGLLGEKGQRTEALEMVEQQIESAGKDRPDFLAIKAELLADDGRAEEGLAVLDDAVAAHPGNPSLLNSRCWLKGTWKLALDTALKDCTRAIELSDNPAPALDSRAMVYFRLGRTEEALGDLNAALDSEPDMAAALYMRGVIRKAAGQAGSDGDLAGARMMSPRIDTEYGKWGIKP